MTQWVWFKSEWVVVKIVCNRNKYHKGECIWLYKPLKSILEDHWGEASIKEILIIILRSFLWVAIPTLPLLNQPSKFFVIAGIQNSALTNIDCNVVMVTEAYCMQGWVGVNGKVMDDLYKLSSLVNVWCWWIQLPDQGNTWYKPVTFFFFFFNVTHGCDKRNHSKGELKHVPPASRHWQASVLQIKESQPRPRDFLKCSTFFIL